MSISKEKLYNILDICSQDEILKENVIKNHDNNLWWPINVKDYRMRLLISGMSTRVGYSMINSYVSVINKMIEIGYDNLIIYTEEQIKNVIRPLGLINARYKYIASMIKFIEKYKEQVFTIKQNDLIVLINKEVNGASYKVGQCCVLYLKGYYESGVMPVDSGMKDTFLPCIGFNEFKGAIGHEVLRHDLEKLISELDLKPLIINNGYEGKIAIPNDNALTWWAHLVLIYYKRAYCNKHKPNECKIKKELQNIELNCKCEN